MSAILITGGHGYIGSHTAYALLDAGYQIAIADNYSAGVRVNFPDQVRCYEGDIGDPRFIDQLFDEVKPQSVMHFAGSIIVPLSIIRPEIYYSNNVAASLCLIKACLRHHVRHFVFSSTAAVYGIPEKGIAREESKTAPINPYGWSKLMIEQILADISAAHDFNYATLRYFNVAGADPKLRTGQSTPQATHLVKIACETAIGKRSQMGIFGTDYKTPDGTCVRDYIHVSDLAAAHLAAFDYIRAKEKNAIFNCGNGKGFSVREVISAVERVSKRSIHAIAAPRRQGDPPTLIADPSLIKRETGWQAQITEIEEIIATALAWEKKSLEKV